MSGTASGATWGARTGYVAATGIYSYNQMRGAAYRRLIDLGADEATARAAATDEAVVSALIEMVDAGIDLATLGTAKIASPVWQKVARMLLAYGINILGEGGEESLQEAVSISNDDRVARGEYDAFDNAWGNKLGLIFDSAGTTVDAVTGRDTGARDAMLRSGLEGMKVAALFGAPGMVVSNFSGYDASDSAGTTSGSTESDADIMTETEQNAQTTESTVQSDDGYGIINKKLPYLETKAENSTELTYTQAELSEIGETMLDMGIIPDKPFLDAMGVDEATARGIQAVMWLSRESDPEAQQTMEMMIDLAEGSSKPLLQQDADSVRAPVAVNAYALNGFDGANVFSGFGISDQDGQTGISTSLQSGGSRTIIPDNVKDIVKQIKENNGTPLKGYKGGKIYRNLPLSADTQKLPEGVNYREYDIHPYIKGQNRGAERLVMGDDGSVWYTNDHYQTFTRIE